MGSRGRREGKEGMEDRGHITESVVTSTSSVRASTRLRLGCRAYTIKTAVTRPRRVRSCRRKNADRGSARGRMMGLGKGDGKRGGMRERTSRK